jgi:hypothetical protein
VSRLLRVYEPSECGSDGYPLAWHIGEPAVKDLVREQAGHRCVRCNHPFVVGETPGEWSRCALNCDHGGPIRVGHDDIGWSDFDDWKAAREFQVTLAMTKGLGLIEARWRVLTVHHLTGNKADLRWWNLAALCQRCHLEIQGRVRMEQVYPHEHSEWFKPYAAGYYAHVYLGEDLTREQTIDRLDELLGLEAVA